MKHPWLFSRRRDLCAARFLRPKPIPSMFRAMPTDSRREIHSATAIRRSAGSDGLSPPLREIKFRLGFLFCNTPPKLCQHG
jgi:hypothetical protein